MLTKKGVELWHSFTRVYKAIEEKPQLKLDSVYALYPSYSSAKY